VRRFTGAAATLTLPLQAFHKTEHESLGYSSSDPNDPCDLGHSSRYTRRRSG
jgi:hypothetical protein